MKINKFMKTLAGAVAASFLLVTAPTTAFADSTGGTGGGGGTGTLSSPQWAVAAGTKGYAWKTFLKKSNNSDKESWFVTEVTNRGADVSICKNSTVIWWVMGTFSGNSKSGWIYNYSGKTYGSAWSGTGTLDNPKTQYNRNASSQELANIKEWAEDNGTLDGGNYTILCSRIDPPPVTEEKTEPRNKETVSSSTSTASTEDTYTYTDIYSYSASVSPLSIEGKFVGGGTWTPENAVVQKTAFGDMYDSLATSGSQKSTDELKTLVTNAVEADKTKTFNPTITLSDANKAFFAKGGVLNVYEYSVKATVTAVTKTDTTTTTTTKKVQPQKRTGTRTKTWNQNTGAYNDWSSWSWGPWVNNGASSSTSTQSVTSSKSNNVSKSFQTQQNSGFWQLISVHCNKAQFDALVNATEATVIDTGDSTKGISAVAQSKKYDSQPASLDFGNPDNPNAAAKASGFMSFYDKECPFDCTASKSTTDGASANNGATTNVGTSGENSTTGNKNGAVSSNVNGNYFEFFRDNDAKTITVDVWYPKTDGVVDYKSNASSPLTTTITRSSDGTPDVNTTSGGKFVMKSGSNTLFTGTNDAANQKNWETKIFSNSTSTILNDLHRTFTVQSSWASEAGKPQVLNFKWEYAPSVSTKFPSTLGFSRTGTTGSTALSASNVVSSSTPIQGKCYANFGTTTSTSTVDAFQNNTGSGVTNSIDGTLINGKGTNPKDVATNLVVNFVRSTTE